MAEYKQELYRAARFQEPGLTPRSENFIVKWLCKFYQIYRHATRARKCARSRCRLSDASLLCGQARGPKTSLRLNNVQPRVLPPLVAILPLDIYHHHSISTDIGLVGVLFGVLALRATNNNTYMFHLHDLIFLPLT